LLYQFSTVHPIHPLALRMSEIIQSALVRGSSPMVGSIGCAIGCFGLNPGVQCEGTERGPQGSLIGMEWVTLRLSPMRTKDAYLTHFEAPTPKGGVAHAGADHS